MYTILSEQLAMMVMRMWRQEVSSRRWWSGGVEQATIIRQSDDHDERMQASGWAWRVDGWTGKDFSSVQIWADSDERMNTTKRFRQNTRTLNRWRWANEYGKQWFVSTRGRSDDISRVCYRMNWSPELSPFVTKSYDGYS